MPFTQTELDNITNSTLAYYTDLGNNKSPIWQHLQARPFLKALRPKQDKVPGGDDFRISMPFIAETTSAFMGYEHDDEVTYGNPANTKRAVFSMKELHAGLEMHESELKRNGITVLNDAGGETGKASKAEKIQLQNILKNKMKDLSEGSMQSLEEMLHLDGSQSAKEPAGLQSLILDNPAAQGAVIGGVDTSADINAKFRNRHNVDNSGTGNANGGKDDRIDATGGTPITQFFQSEIRQLTRYGGQPNLALCGSDFLDRLIKELLDKGNYTDRGWSSNGATDIKVADIHYGNMVFAYDPGMDDIGEVVPGGVDFRKRCYLIDTSHLKLCVQDGYDFKARRPSRSPDKYAIYRALNWTGALTLDQPNSCGVYEFK